MTKKETPPEKRFGAMAYVETFDDDSDGETEELSLDSLRKAFAALDETDVSEFPTDEFSESEVQANQAVEEIEYDELPFFEENDGFSPDDRTNSAAEDVLSEDEDAFEPNPTAIVEAMLFVGDRDNRPLDPIRAAEKMRNVEPEEIERIVRRLNRNYQNLGCPYTILKEKEGYRMVLRKEFQPIQAKFYGKIREARLSQQAIDTLAVVAYRQPITADEVQKIRRQPSSGLLSQLVRRELLCVEQQMEGKKKILLYKTTDRFLELFQLESIEDLPISEDIDFR